MPKRKAFATVAWTLLWLLAIDFAANVLFAYPRDPRNTQPNAVALYFDYGRSMEGRLRRATRADPAAAAPITQAGWYEPLVATRRPPKPDGVEVTIYGMSHAMRLADALQTESDRYSVRSVGAPGATMNWAYGAYLRDQDKGSSKVAILAVMSSTLPMIVSPAPMDWNTSFALPYTADRFVAGDGGIKRLPPPYDSFREYVRTLDDPAAWERANAWFARHDPYYDRFLVRETWLDNSTMFRLIRRALAQRRDRALRDGARDGAGFRPDSEAVRVANALIADFARTARANGQVPVIYAVDSMGYGDDLYRVIAGTLQREKVAYLSTHTVIDPQDPTAYLADSHFTDENDRLLARAMAQVIDRAMPSPPRAPRP